MDETYLRHARRAAGIRRIRFGRALPTFRECLVGGAGWGILMAASAALGAWTRGYLTPQSIAAVAATYFVGGALALPPSLTIYRLAVRGKPKTARFAAALMVLTVGTAATTALVYALWYRDYAADFATASLSPGFVLGFVLTVLGNVYQFAVLGLPFYMPLGLAAALLASGWLVRETRR